MSTTHLVPEAIVVSHERTIIFVVAPILIAGMCSVKNKFEGVYQSQVLRADSYSQSVFFFR